MTNEEFFSLMVGDMVRSKSNGQTYIVTAHYGSRATATKTVDITRPDEWELVWGEPRPPKGKL